MTDLVNLHPQRLADWLHLARREAWTTALETSGSNVVRLPADEPVTIISPTFGAINLSLAQWAGLMGLAAEHQIRHGADCQLKLDDEGLCVTLLPNYKRFCLTSDGVILTKSS